MLAVVIIQFIMKIEDVKKRLLKIENCKGDDEMTHCYEDDLFYDFVNAIKNGQLYIAHDNTFDKLMLVYFSNMLNRKKLIKKKDINNNYFLDIKPKTDFIDKPLEDEMVKNLRERLEKYVITEPNIDLHNDLGKLPENQWEILSKEFNNNKDVTELLNIYKCK